MTEIRNDIEFRQKIESLPLARQRLLAARFVATGSVVWAAYRLVDVVSRVLEAKAAAG